MIISILSALAEPTRLNAIRLLADGDKHCVCELMKLLRATQSRMSRHMQVLKKAGLGTDRRDAQWVRYRLNPDMPHNVAKLIEMALTVETEQERVAA
ncbi:ArsR/SmtB family transcription factor [Pseudorhodobacter aquimaris]|uniref:ArsR/SmtB family transcription factor n=1 Tax=Pseudorhodobacter aquimaris TaxID=687412 RepID=UPI00067E45E8|nr:metalloregulator ArsR/SmtB family transcription factor [Pseudorhodobacter aquimaris]